MNAKYALIGTAGILLLLAACTGSKTEGYEKVRIETYPLDGICELTGHRYSMTASAPADLVVPLSAAPLVVVCSTESGYEGRETLSTIDDPWSPANVGSLGLGYFLDKSAGSGQRFPKLLLVTMVYTEAGTPEDLRNAKQPATGAEISKQGPSMTDYASTEKPGFIQEKTAKMATDEGLPTPSALTKESDRMPSPKATPQILKTGPKTATLPAGSANAPAPPAKMPLFAFDVRVHLASFKKHENAERTWQKLSRFHSDLLNSLSSLIEPVDIPKKGKFYRVYAGPMANLTAASELCKTLKSRKVYCRPVASGAK